MKNRGQLFILAIVFAVIFAIAAALGIYFVKDITNALGSRYLIIGSIVILAVIFHTLVETVLLTVWSWVQAIVKRVF